MYFTLMYFTLCTYSDGLRTEETLREAFGKKTLHLVILRTLRLSSIGVRSASFELKA